MNADDCINLVRRRYAGGRDRLFILHGNTGDLFPHGEGEAAELHTLPDFIFRQLTPDAATKASRIWMHYGVGHGLRWMNPESHGMARIAKILGYTADRLDTIRSPQSFFSLIDDVCRRPESGGAETEELVPLRAVVTEAHMIFPEAQTHFMRPEDRQLLVQLRRFAAEPVYDSTNTLIILVAPTLASVHRELRQVAVTIECSRPSEAEVSDFLELVSARHGLSIEPSAVVQLRRLAVGLTRRHMENIASECAAFDEPLTTELVAARREELVARDYGDFLEFFEPTWTLDDVGGSPEAISELKRFAEALRSGDRDIPSGIIVGGQNGIGKTFLLKGFAGTAGITAVILKPFKDSGFGASERNWQKIATALKSAGQVIVIVQEADAQLGQRTGAHVHETSKAILAQQLSLMGDPRYRGKILWLLDTCRPDKLAPDVKRPGRCDRMIPLYPIVRAEDAKRILKAQLGLLRRKLDYRFAPDFMAKADALTAHCIGKTPAQLERSLQRAKRHFAAGDPITVAHVLAVMESSSREGAEPEAYLLQRLIATVEAVETENADLIPPFYRQEMEDLGGLAPLKLRIADIRSRTDTV